MTIRNGDVRPGKCFSTQGDDAVRRVISVRDGTVAFEQRGQKVTSRSWSVRSELSVAESLAEASLEVGCDYVPNKVSQLAV